MNEPMSFEEAAAHAAVAFQDVVNSFVHETIFDRAMLGAPPTAKALAPQPKSGEDEISSEAFLLKVQNLIQKPAR
jgi:hypothetical protein